MNRTARIAATVTAALGMTIMANSVAQAATGDMNEVIRINDTPTLVKNVYEREVQEEFAFLDSSLPFKNVTGVVGEESENGFMITISMSKMEGLRTQSHLAPLASIAASTALYVGAPKSGEAPNLFEEEPTLALPDETTACIAAAATSTIIDEHKVIVTDADIVAMHDAIAAEFSLAPADVITKAFWRGYDARYAACGIDTSLI